MTEQAFDLPKVVRIVRRNKLLIGVCAAASLFGGAAFAVVSHQTFTSTAQVVLPGAVQSAEAALGSPVGAGTSTSDYMGTQVVVAVVIQFCLWLSPTSGRPRRCRRCAMKFKLAVQHLASCRLVPEGLRPLTQRRPPTQSLRVTSDTSVPQPASSAARRRASSTRRRMPPLRRSHGGQSLTGFSAVRVAL